MARELAFVAAAPGVWRWQGSAKAPQAPVQAPASSASQASSFAGTQPLWSGLGLLTACAAAAAAGGRRQAARRAAKSGGGRGLRVGGCCGSEVCGCSSPSPGTPRSRAARTDGEWRPPMTLLGGEDPARRDVFLGVAGSLAWGSAAKDGRAREAVQDQDSLMGMKVQRFDPKAPQGDQCPRCKDGIIKCVRCNGSGRVLLLNNKDYADCEECQHFGQSVCSQCYGTGWGGNKLKTYFKDGRLRASMASNLYIQDGYYVHYGIANETIPALKEKIAKVVAKYEERQAKKAAKKAEA